MTDREMASPGDQATPDQQKRAPVALADRIVSLDFIRGIAVLGILFANIVGFAQPSIAYIWPPALGEGASRVDETFWLIQFILVDGKFRVLFTLLFGAGLYLFMERAWARGAGRGLQARRLLVLLVFGLVHFFLIWIGDILTLYAVWGLVALVTMKWQAKTQLRTGLAIVLIKAVLTTALMVASYVATDAPLDTGTAPVEAGSMAEQITRESLAEAQQDIAVYQGSYADILAARFSESTTLLRQLIMTGATETFALILIGMALYRRGFFNGAVDPARLRRWGWGLLLPGLALSAAAGLWPWATGFEYTKTMLVFNGLGEVPQLMSAFGFLFLLIVFSPAAVRGALGQRLVAAGRMAFSNYLGTSVLMMPIFHGWGLGLFGEVGRVEMFAIVLVVWVLMLAWSKPWLNRFNYGPLEWLWRCLTYGRMFPLRREAAN